MSAEVSGKDATSILAGMLFFALEHFSVSIYSKLSLIFWEVQGESFTWTNILRYITILCSALTVNKIFIRTNIKNFS